MPRLLSCMLVLFLATGPFAQTSAAGSSRAVLSVTARVVHACTITVPPPHSRGRGKGPVNHRCKPNIPHHVSVAPFSPPTERDANPRRGRVTVKPDRGAAGDVMVVTVTY